MAIEFTQPLTEVSTRNRRGGKELPALKVNNITLSVSRLHNVRSSTIGFRDVSPCRL
jgi:hypothetical protein